MERYGNLIDGKMIYNDNAQWFRSWNPANIEECLGEFVESTVEDVDLAIHHAYEAGKRWSSLPSPQRATILEKAIQYVGKHLEELAQIMTREQGKPLAEARGEINKSIAESKFMIGEGLRLYGYTVPSERPSVWTKTIRVPIGTVAAITPWNFPVLTPLRKIIPALVAGNTVVLKPSELTPLTGLKLVQLLYNGGLPEGIVNVITGGKVAGKALISHPLIKGITFTGSTEVGKAISASAALRLVRVQAEMGGKNPVIVWDPPNLQEAIKHIVGAAFQCSGQRCTAISRVIVPKDELRKMETLLAEELTKLRIGNGLEQEVNLGPLISEQQMNNVDGYVQRAIAEGARLIIGGQRLSSPAYLQGYFYPATLFSDVTPHMEIAQQEIFGPVLCLQPADTFDEALLIANHTEYGLASSLFSKDLKMIGKFVEHIQSGMVHVNHGTTPESHMPFGGVKESAMGPGSVGVTTKDFFTDIKSVYIKYA